MLFDAQQIKQAVINILKNAMEAMENGGTLIIRTYDVPGNAGGGDRDRRHGPRHFRQGDA